MLERGVADVFINEIYIVEVVSKYVNVLQLVCYGSEANEYNVEFHA